MKSATNIRRFFLDGDEVTLPYDKPMFEWLQAAGFHPQKQNAV